MMAILPYYCGFQPNRLFITHKNGEVIALTQVLVTKEKRSVDSEGVLLFIHYRSLLAVLLSRFRALHKNWFYYQNIKCGTFSFQKAPTESI